MRTESLADFRFEPSDVARANEVAQGNIKPDDVVPVMRKRTGPNGTLATVGLILSANLQVTS